VKNSCLIRANSRPSQSFCPDNNGYGINAFDIDLSIRNSVGNNSTNYIDFDPGYGIGGDWGPFEPAFSNTHPSANFVDE
jgi:hypothetical protein